MAEVVPSTPQSLGLPEILATVLKWRDTPTPLTQETFHQAVEEIGNGLQAIAEKDDALSYRIRSIAGLVLGNLHRDHGLLDHALPFYDAAIEDSDENPDTSDEAKADLANILINRGICKLSRNQPEELASALEDFDRSLEIRKNLSDQESDSHRWNLTSTHMNRGDVLHRIGNRNAEALDAYNQAIAILETLPVDGNPAVRQRHALAWSNRGLVSENHEDARACFERCISILEEPASPAELLTLCNAILNRGRNSLQILDDTEATAADARTVLDLLASHERNHPAPAELGLQARHLLSHALVTWLDDSRKGPGPAEDWIASTTDTVEDALELERHWERHGISGLRPLASDLFDLGLHVYRVCQPHFLAEFLIESMDPEASPGAPFTDQRFQAAAARHLRQAVNETAQRATDASTPQEEVEKAARILGSLKAADQRLSQLQQAMASAKA